ncbi:MAG TPA: aminoglycoside phosphotransferase family protein [Anaerolineales bacterium]|nr:aminoglycoside phosphotransferase family protein [Anaerolineales bacterium]
MEKIITFPQDATPEWLTEIFHTNGHLPAGEVVSVKQGYRMFGGSTIIPLDLEYSPGATATAPRRVLLKLPDPRGEKTGDQEVDFYTRIAPLMDPSPGIRCYHAANEDGLGFTILMEDLSESHESHIPSFIPPLEERGRMMVDTLARFHAFWWDHPKLGGEVGDFPTEAGLARWQEEYQGWTGEFFDEMGDRLSARERKIVEGAREAILPRMYTRYFIRKHLTLIHSDPHAGNFLYPRDPAKDTLRIIDWKSWHINLGVDDMAHMMGLFWFPTHRARWQEIYLRQYHETLRAHGVEGYSWEMCWADYRLAAATYVLYPIWQWSREMPELIWWHNFQRILITFDELNCAEFLET